jgi:hypothetical protein
MLGDIEVAARMLEEQGHTFGIDPITRTFHIHILFFLLSVMKKTQTIKQRTISFICFV